MLLYPYHVSVPKATREGESRGSRQCIECREGLSLTWEIRPGIIRRGLCVICTSKVGWFADECATNYGQSLARDDHYWDL